MDAQALDAAGIGIEHFDLESAGTGNDFAAHRQAADMGDEIAAQRLDFLAGFAGDEIPADHGTDAVEARAADPSLDPWYRPPSLALTVNSGAPSYDGVDIGVAQVSWYRGMCEGVTVVRGRCPTGASEAMVSQTFAEDVGVRLGTPIQLGITSDPAADRVIVVGTYDPTTADPAVWGLERPGQYAPNPVPDGPDRYDDLG